MLVFAYDGSLNGDWVAHYAARFAANAPERRLRLVHVHEASTASQLQERIARIAGECKLLGVALEPDLVAPGGADDVATRLLARVPKGATLIAGTRARQRHSAFLARTVTARLLEAGRFPVIAIRVVHPGVLGQPGSVLLPLAADPRAAAHALFLLRLLGEDLRKLHVLAVRELPRLRLRIVSRESARRTLVEGRAFVASVEEALRTGLAPHRFELDSSVVVCDDASREVLLHAARYRSRLICLDASERTLPSRLFSRDPVERVLRETPSDVAVYRSLD